MTQCRLTVLTIGVLLAAMAAGLAWSGPREFEFDTNDFTNSTTLTNNYWGLRLGGPSSAVYFSEGSDGCDRRIHPSDSIQLSMSPVSRIAEPAALENSNGLLHGDKCGTSTIQEVLADLQCATQTSGL